MSKSKKPKSVDRFKFKPFTTKRGRTVINELCTCGALRTQHERRFNHEASNGHGPCIATGCPQFTWERFVYGNGGK